jgi:hypothetical protein
MKWSILLILVFLAPTAQAEAGDWVFSVAGDMRRYVYYQDIHGWDQACQAMATEGPGAFLVSPGDLDQQYTTNPGNYVYQIIEEELGAGFPFFPGIGNHELDDMDTTEWIRGFDHGGPTYAVNPGPPGSDNTTYSWDHDDAHFVMLNECFDGVSDIGSREGNWNAVLDSWLEADLTANTLPLVFVFGHFPAFPQVDRDTGLALHHDDTDFNMFDNGAYRDALWSILSAHGVTAYVCGHSHTSSVVQIDGVWQIDFGHARGPRDPNWHGPSTFMRFVIGAEQSVTLETWRQPFTDTIGGEAPYTKWHTDILRAASASAADELPASAHLGAAWPNPFNPQTSISWQQPEVGHASITIYNLLGRRISSLVESTYSTGSHSITWGGQDDRGRNQPAGTYLVKLQVGKTSDVIKLVLAR